MSTCKLSSLLFLLVCLFVLPFLQICMLLIRQQFPSPPSPQKKILYATLTSTDSMIAIHVHYIKIQPCTHAFGRTSEGRERLVHLFAHAEKSRKKGYFSNPPHNADANFNMAFPLALNVYKCMYEYRIYGLECV